MTEIAEASMNFDAEMVGPFLRQVSSLDIGFGPKHVATVLETVDDLEVNEQRELRMELAANGQTEPMTIRVLKDDVDALVLYFLATPQTADKIDRQMERFCKEHGL
jgi:hypothetical protein